MKYTMMCRISTLTDLVSLELLIIVKLCMSFARGFFDPSHRLVSVLAPYEIQGMARSFPKATTSSSCAANSQAWKAVLRRIAGCPAPLEYAGTSGPLFHYFHSAHMPSTLLASPSGSASSLRTRVFAEQMCLAHTSSHDINASFRVAWRATARHTSPRAPEVTTPVPSRKHQATTIIRLQRVGCLVLCQVRHCDADACACGLCTDRGPPCRSKCQKPLNKCAATIGGAQRYPDYLHSATCQVAAEAWMMWHHQQLGHASFGMCLCCRCGHMSR